MNICLNCGKSISNFDEFCSYCQDLDINTPERKQNVKANKKQLEEKINELEEKLSRLSSQLDETPNLVPKPKSNDVKEYFGQFSNINAKAFDEFTTNKRAEKLKEYEQEYLDKMSYHKYNQGLPKTRKNYRTRFGTKLYQPERIRGGTFPKGFTLPKKQKPKHISKNKRILLGILITAGIIATIAITTGNVFGTIILIGLSPILVIIIANVLKLIKINNTKQTENDKINISPLQKIMLMLGIAKVNKQKVEANPEDKNRGTLPRGF